MKRPLENWPREGRDARGLYLSIQPFVITPELLIVRSVSCLRSGVDSHYQAWPFPPTPTDAPRLAARLETAIADMRRAADTDPKWRALSDALARSGTAVNQDDTSGAAAAFQDVHDGCVGAKITTG